MILWQLFHFSHQNDKKEIEDVKLDAEKPKLCSCFKQKTLWDWLELFIVPGILAAMTLSWNLRVHQQATDKEQGELVRNYINSITTLILDQYHHGKVAKFPEISVQEVESFLRAKTANTLQALNKGDKKHKQNVINFLSEAGIGFFPPYKSDGYDSKLLIQNICLNGDVEVVNDVRAEEKDITFHHFFCKIGLSNVVLNDVKLKAVIWEGAKLENAQMREAILEQADFQGAWLNEVDLTGANLTRANLKGAFLQEANLKNTELNQANFRGAILGSPNLQEEESEPTNLENAELKGVSLREGWFKEVNFKNAIMKPFCVIKQGQEQQYKDKKKEECEREIIVNLRDAQLQGADFRGTNLKRANLRGADLTDAKMNITTNLEGAIYDNETQLPPFLKLMNHRKRVQEQIRNKTMIKIHPMLGQYTYHPISGRYTYPLLHEYDPYKYNKYERENLEKWGLSDVDLRGADLTNANLSEVDLRRADLRGVRMAHANLEGAKLENALYDDHTQLPNDFGSNKETKEAEARRRGMIKIVPGADLEKKDIKYADLSEADLSNSKLQGAKLSNVDFDHDTNWKNAQFDSQTQLPFDRNTAIRYGMRYAPHQDQLNWEGENHQKENLQNAILRGGIFKDTILKQAKLQKADFSEADLTHADLTGANLSKATLTGVQLEETNLTDANLRGVIVAGEEKEEFRQQLEKAILCRTALPILSEDEVRDKKWKNSLENRDCLKEE